MSLIKQTFTLPGELDMQLRNFCKEKDVTMSAVIRQGIRKVINNEMKDDGRKTTISVSQ